MLPTLTLSAALHSLKAGDEGWWPVIAQMPRDIRVGDLLEFPEGDVFLVAESRPGKDITRWAIVPQAGEIFTIGQLNRDFHLYRWGTHTHLADSCV